MIYYSVFCSGSCRILCCFDTSIITNKMIESIHYVNLNLMGGNNFIGKLHTPKQHLQFLMYICGDIQICDNDLKNLFSMKTDRLLTYIKYEPNYVFENAINNIRNNIFDQKIFIFELCSIKYAINKVSGITIQGELSNENNTNSNNIYSSYDVFLEDTINLINYVNTKFNNPLIILIGHLRNWKIKDNFPFIKDRHFIFDTLNIFENKYNNVRIIDPVTYINENDLEDDYHYNTNGFNIIHNTIYNLITEYFNTYKN